MQDNNNTFCCEVGLKISSKKKMYELWFFVAVFFFFASKTVTPFVVQGFFIINHLPCTQDYSFTFLFHFLFLSLSLSLFCCHSLATKKY